MSETKLIPKHQTGKTIKSLNIPHGKKGMFEGWTNEQILNYTRKRDAEADKQELERRKEAIAKSNSTNDYGSFRDQMAYSAVGEKFRFFPNDPRSAFDNHFNPLRMVGSMADNIGHAWAGNGTWKDKALSIAAPLAVGAVAGIGANTTGQFVNNLANPIAGLDQAAINAAKKGVHKVINTKTVRNFAEQPVGNLIGKGKQHYDELYKKLIDKEDALARSHGFDRSNSDWNHFIWDDANTAVRDQVDKIYEPLHNFQKNDTPVIQHVHDKLVAKPVVKKTLDLLEKTKLGSARRQYMQENTVMQLPERKGFTGEQVEEFMNSGKSSMTDGMITVNKSYVNMDNIAKSKFGDGQLVQDYLRQGRNANAVRDRHYELVSNAKNAHGSDMFHASINPAQKSIDDYSFFSTGDAKSATDIAMHLTRNGPNFYKYWPGSLSGDSWALWSAITKDTKRFAPALNDNKFGTPCGINGCGQNTPLSKAMKEYAVNPSQELGEKVQVMINDQNTANMKNLLPEDMADDMMSTLNNSTQHTQGATFLQTPVIKYPKGQAPQVSREAYEEWFNDFQKRKGNYFTPRPTPAPAPTQAYQSAAATNAAGQTGTLAERMAASRIEAKTAVANSLNDHGVPHWNDPNATTAYSTFENDHPGLVEAMTDHVQDRVYQANGAPRFPSMREADMELESLSRLIGQEYHAGPRSQRSAPSQVQSALGHNVATPQLIRPTNITPEAIERLRQTLQRPAQVGRIPLPLRNVPPPPPNYLDNVVI